MIDRIRNRFGTVGLMVAALVVVGMLAAGAALAAWLIGQNVNVSASTASAELNFIDIGTDPGPVTTVNGLGTCTATIEADGSLTVAFDGGEENGTCEVSSIGLQNQGDFSMNNLRFDFGGSTDFGPDDTYPVKVEKLGGFAGFLSAGDTDQWEPPGTGLRFTLTSAAGYGETYVPTTIKVLADRA